VWPTLPELVRGIILGEKNADGVRPNRLLAENGVEITEVDVLSSSIDDRSVADFVQEVQTESVVLQLGDRKAKETLSSALMRETLSQEQHQLSISAKEREAKLGELVKNLTFSVAMLDAKNMEAIAREKQTLSQEREQEAQAAKAKRVQEAKENELRLLMKEAEARANAARLVDEVEVSTKEQMQSLAVRLIETRSMATVTEREAVQKGLIEAMTALGDKVMLSEVAKNMNLVSLFQGKPAGEILAEVLRGLPIKT
jgi:major vault protein